MARCCFQYLQSHLDHRAIAILHSLASHEKGCFSVIFFLQFDSVSISVSVVVSFVIILPSSKFIFVVPMSRRVSTRGCFNSIFFLALCLLKNYNLIRYTFC